MTGQGSTGEEGTFPLPRPDPFTSALSDSSTSVTLSSMSTNGLEFGYCRNGLVVLRNGLVLDGGSAGATERDMKGTGDRAEGVTTLCSNLPASPQEKCVTVTGVGDRPVGDTGDGSSSLLSSAPLSDRVNLSPPYSRHIGYRNTHTQGSIYNKTIWFSLAPSTSNTQTKFEAVNTPFQLSVIASPCLK